MSAAANGNDGSKRSVAEVVADWRSKCARGEPVDAEALFADIEQATIDLAMRPTLSLQPPSSQRLQPPAAASHAGDGIADYDILREIARGGMGVVYEARQRSLNRTVALKMIKPGQLDGEGVARFYAEAESAANLRHPNIVAVYEVGRADTDGQHYFTMDFVAGPSLLELIRKQPLEARRAAELVAKVARAIQFAHERGVLHRDLKPSNILIGEDGEPRVTDFGLAKRIDQDSQLTIAGAVVGTPNYMPPEQARGEHERVSPRSDVYSLGAVLYECLTGRPPLVAARLADILALVINEEPLPPSRLSPKVPRDLETICLKCLEKEPTRRYATAGELADDLARFLHDEPIRARPIGFVERATKLARRKPAWAALAMVVALSAVALIGTIAVYTSSLSAKNAELDSSNSQLQRTNTDLRHTNYAALIDKTEDYWIRDPRNLARGMALLNSLVPADGEEDLRGIEWYFLRRLCDLEQQVVYQGSEGVQHLCCNVEGGLIVHDPGREESLVLFADGTPASRKVLARGDDVVRWQFAANSPWCLAWTKDHKLELRSSEAPDRAGEEIARNEPPNIPVSFAQDGSLVAMIPKGQPPAIWRREEPGRFRAITTDIAEPLNVGLSPDGKWAAVMGKEEFTVVNVETRKANKIKLNGLRNYTAIEFSQDGKRLALSSSRGQLDVVLLGDQVVVASLNMHHDFATPLALEFLPRGHRLVMGSSNSNVLVVNLGENIVNMSEQDTAIYRGHRSGVTHLAVDPAGKFLYSGGEDGQVLRWDLSIQDQRTHDIIEQTGIWFMNFNCLSYSPDGRWLAAGGVSYVNGKDMPSGRLVLIDVTSRQVRHRLDTPHPVTACSFSPSGKLLIYGTAGDEAAPQFYLWNVETEKAMDGLLELESARAACFAAAGPIVFAAPVAGLQSWEPSRSSSPWWTHPSKQPVQIEELVASANGNILAGRSSGGVLRWWDKTGAQRLQSVGHSPATALALSAEGTLAAWTLPDASVASDNTEAHEKTSPEAALAVKSPREQQAIVFDLAANRIRFTIGGHSSPIAALAISADGKRLASGDHEGILKLWDTATGQELMAIEDAQMGRIRAIAFHPDNRQMATIGSSDAKVRIWWTE
jgi:serine/threonine protein kinase/WD40 repeat protein